MRVAGVENIAAMHAAKGPMSSEVAGKANACR
ncbi:hypothetical protein CPPEL_05870 [Corynebacterium pseudopelargi]|uniref:Uncharacterized protein n=1 Tax=Corynebacterium pseudopelargi TaxID=2080757 RepID=A0A3G6IUI2_9CORY|nr:hypothetical protein CPPEL_05870 [Corynebacterium pseudopelargi]